MHWSAPQRALAGDEIFAASFDIGGLVARRVSRRTVSKLAGQAGISRTHEHRKDGGICVVQSKTDEELWIPEHRELTAELGRGVATIGTLLVTPTQGKPFDETYYGAWMADAIDKAGLPDDCVLHGLRKTAARTLADLGLSEETIKAITAHVTSRMVAKYVKGANQQRLAKEGSRRWENSR